ncbi:polar amino acid transport system substrate-binding protein [Nocardioides alpinus]|uniref:Amino acid ABC transporter substrate-binding protein n=1 Tax=Nocardioides alpinus TaxID=748909 RepID=A0A1I0VVA4_9ACTN|nr:ABC transporter substrate-binding protein [Nocardioides alpinus]PKH37511.1 amino acid ABC transporter substrate-binding protein [Nocardioides alpinus]SFA80355.1 polar amino acid transport system substrate-binding protein [Nocardioides alpinus]
MTRTARRLSPARTAAAALSSVALLATLSGCGGAASGESADALSEVSLVFKGVLTVCTDMPYAPFEFEENGKPTGFDIDLIQKVADGLDVDLDVVDVAFDDITSGTSLNTDACDVAISAMTITGERARVLDFSSPYFDAKQALITPRGSGLDEIAELAGKRVGVQKDTTGETYLSDFAPETTQVIAYDDAAGLQDALAAGDLDAAMLDNTVSGQFVGDNPSLKLAREFDTGEQYGMAVKKDGNIPLLREINGTLAGLREDGTYDKIFSKYFG